MPYILQERRNKYESLEDIVPKDVVKGELTYCFYHLALQYINQTGERYQNISDAIAALNDAAAEVRRRVLEPYEDKQIAKNGDIDIGDNLIKRMSEGF